MLKIIDYISILLKYSTEVTFIIPSVVFDEEKDPKNHFEDARRAYSILKKDDLLEVLEVPINPGTDDELLEITIKRKQYKG